MAKLIIPLVVSTPHQHVEGWVFICKKPEGGGSFVKIIIPHDQRQNGFNKFKVRADGKVEIPLPIDRSSLGEPQVTHGQTNVFRGMCTIITYPILHPG
jgi:hypothetical protein